MMILSFSHQARQLIIIKERERKSLAGRAERIFVDFNCSENYPRCCLTIPHSHCVCCTMNNYFCNIIIVVVSVLLSTIVDVKRT